MCVCLIDAHMLAKLFLLLLHDACVVPDGHLLSKEVVSLAVLIIFVYSIRSSGCPSMDEDDDRVPTPRLLIQRT
jgi:hypothetical protein